MSQLIYCDSYFKYQRSRSSEVKVGMVVIGGDFPIRVQSMTTTPTIDTSATVLQAKLIIDAGGELVRMTTQGRSEARNLKNIQSELESEGYVTPLVADIHYNPNAAEIAAQIVSKVRINPGNFTDGAKKFRSVDVDELSWQKGIEQVKEKLIPFLNICKDNNTAIRIGANHGSLSDRIMSRYGDTPEGMVESCMEFLRICIEQEFYNIVLSIKASNTRIMVHTVRLLAAKMRLENMSFPLHLGVTEAGEGEDGRIKSAVGIGALLADGIGDTIRVSLTEAPENEIGVAKTLIEHVQSLANLEPIEPIEPTFFTPFEYNRRKTRAIFNIGAFNSPVVVQQYSNVVNAERSTVARPDFVFCDDIKQMDKLLLGNHKIICSYDIYSDFSSSSNCYPLLSLELYETREQQSESFLLLSYSELTTSIIAKLKDSPLTVVVADADAANGLFEQRALIWKLQNSGVENPVIIFREYVDNSLEQFQLKAAADIGLLFLDGLADGVFIKNKQLDDQDVLSTQFNILQAARVRFVKTDYISCPGCGRTLFALQNVTAEVKERTSHLKNLKIGIMGCVVNGIGEMADADYGYIGSGPNKVSLYKQKELIKKNISSDKALDELISLIKENGDWIDP